MKTPSVLASALLSTLCATAAAQSSVTVYGVIDATLGYGKGSVTSVKSVGSGGLAGSRLGFRGTEDLGGGLKANFLFEHGFNADTGAAASPLSFWNRQSYVGLNNAAGEIQIGRVYTPTFTVHANNDAFGPQGVAAQQVLLGSLEAAQPANLRANNAVNYLSPLFMGGFVVHAMVSAGEGAPGAYRGARVSYTNAGFTGEVAVGRYDSASLGAAKIGDLTALTVGARYKIGDTTLYGLYDRDDSTLFKSHGLQFSAMVIVGAAELKASIAQSVLRSAAGVDVGTTRRLGVGGVYYLSRRTALFTSIAHLDNRNGASTALNGAITAANRGSSGFDLGIRHVF